MSDVVEGVGEIFGISKADRARKSAEQEAANSRNFQLALWERQMGEVSDALKNEMMGILGYEWVPDDTTGTPAPTQGFISKVLPAVGGTSGKGGEWKKAAVGNTWLDKFKRSTKIGIEEGIRPAEESARAALIDRVRANPRSISTQGYAKGLRDIVKEGATQRGSAYRTGLQAAELTPYNLSLAFMGRTPFSPNVSPVYPPDYKTDVDAAKLMGSGLNEMVKWGTSAYNNMFGPRVDDPYGGFEDYMGNEGGNMGMGDLSGIEEGDVF